jgi:polar amino acid transport system substrate-binding protein
MRAKALILVFFALVLTVAVSSLAATESTLPEIRIGAAGFDFAPSIVAREILTEAYTKAGYQPVFLVFPPNRMIASLDSGVIDALLIAEASFSDEHPGSIRIGTKIWVDQLVVFSKSRFSVQGWESLKPYRIGYISAMLIIEKNLAEGYETYPVGNPIQLFKMLEADRTDVIVTSRTLGELTLATLGITDVVRENGKLATVVNYHFLNKEHGDVARRLSVVLEDMDKSGRIAAITNETLSHLFPEKE